MSYTKELITTWFGISRKLRVLHSRPVFTVLFFVEATWYSGRGVDLFCRNSKECVVGKIGCAFFVKEVVYRVRLSSVRCFQELWSERQNEDLVSRRRVKPFDAQQAEQSVHCNPFIPADMHIPKQA